MNDQTENVMHQLFSRRRYFVHRILTNHSEDHDKLIIYWENVFLTNGQKYNLQSYLMKEDSCSECLGMLSKRVRPR